MIMISILDIVNMPIEEYNTKFQAFKQYITPKISTLRISNLRLANKLETVMEDFGNEEGKNAYWHEKTNLYFTFFESLDDTIKDGNVVSVKEKKIMKKAGKKLADFVFNSVDFFQYFLKIVAKNKGKKLDKKTIKDYNNVFVNILYPTKEVDPVLQLIYAKKVESELSNDLIEELVNLTNSKTGF